MRPQRRPVEIFSFSFLDVIACAVGVILFITILAISNTVEQGDPELIEQLRESISTEVTVDRMKAELEENQRKQKEMEAAMARVTELEAQVRLASGQNVLANQYNELLEEYNATKTELEQSRALGDLMPNRSPVARSTNKKAWIYLSFQGGGKVRVATQNNGSFASEHYDVRDSGSETVLTAEGAAASLDELLGSGGSLNQILSRMDPAMHYVECYVEPDAFEDFVKTRAALQAAGWDVGFVFKRDTDTLIYSYSGRSSKVQ